MANDLVIPNRLPGVKCGCLSPWAEPLIRMYSLKSRTCGDRGRGSPLQGAKLHGLRGVSSVDAIVGSWVNGTQVRVVTDVPH